MERADAGGVEPPSLPPARDPEALQHGLRRGASEVGDLGEGRRARHAGGEHDRQQLGLGVAPTARVGHAFEEVKQGEHLGVGELQTGPPREPLGTADGRGQQLPGVAPQGVHEDALGIAVRDIAARASDLEPVGGAVASAGEAPGTNETFGEDSGAVCRRSFARTWRSAMSTTFRMTATRAT